MGKSVLRFSPLANKFWMFLPIVALVLLVASPAKADIVYTFIKMTCDPASKSATITAFYDSGKSGKARIARHENGTYYLGDIASYDPPKPSKRISCNLGGGQKISFIAYHSNVPKNDHLVLFMNGKLLTDNALGYGPWSINIQIVSKNEYMVKDCEPSLPYLRQIPKGMCTLQHVIKGKWDENYQVVSP